MKKLLSKTLKLNKLMQSSEFKQLIENLVDTKTSIILNLIKDFKNVSKTSNGT